GLLAVGQACRDFKITSARSGEIRGLAAEVSLEPFFAKGVETQDLGQLTIGNVTIREFAKPAKDHYTLITLDHVLPVFREKLIPTIAERRGRHFEVRPSKGGHLYADFVNWIAKSAVTRIDQLSGYNRFLWELGLITPVPYLKEGPVVGMKSKVITALKARL